MVCEIAGETGAVADIKARADVSKYARFIFNLRNLDIKDEGIPIGRAELFQEALRHKEILKIEAGKRVIEVRFRLEHHQNFRSFDLFYLITRRGLSQFRREGPFGQTESVDFDLGEEYEIPENELLAELFATTMALVQSENLRSGGSNTYLPHPITERYAGNVRYNLSNDPVARWHQLEGANWRAGLANMP